MTNDVHASTLTEADAEAIDRYFKGYFTGRVNLTVETTEVDGTHALHKLVLRSGTAVLKKCGDVALKVSAFCLEGKDAPEDGAATSGLVGFDRKARRFVTIDDKGKEWVSAPITALLFVSNLRMAA